MPNSPSPDKRRFSYLENRHVAEWLEAVARERGTDVASRIREATLTYYAAHQSSTPVFSDAERAAEKAAQRSETKRRIAERTLTPREAQERNAPLSTPAKVVDLWGALRRRAAQR